MPSSVSKHRCIETDGGGFEKDSSGFENYICIKGHKLLQK